MASSPHPSQDLAPLAGRDAATAAIDAALAAGPPARVVLEGPPGSGTSALLAHAAAGAARRGLAVEHWADGRPAAWWREPDGPVLLCIEEAQELDAAALAAMPPGAVVVAAARSGLPVADPRALAALRGGASAAVALAPLTDAEAYAVLGDSADAGLVASCGGSPKLLALVANRPPWSEPHDERARLLLVVAGWWGAQLDRMGPDCRALADALVVLGDGSALWMASELADLPRVRAAEAADALVDAGLLSTADPLRIAAPLAASALHAGIPEARRDAAHLRAAAILGRAPDGLRAAATHLLAIPPAGASWAAELLREAACAPGAEDTAVALLERALAEPVAAPARAELLVDLGAAHDRAGTPGAEAAYRRALRVAAVGARPRIHLLLGRALYGTGDYRGAGLELERGLDALAWRDEDLAIELLASYVAAARFDRTLEDAAEHHLAGFMERAGPGRTVAERALLAEIALEQGIRGAPRARVVALAQRAWADGLLLEGADPYGIAVSGVAAALTWSDAFADSDAMLTATLARAEADGEALVAATARYLRAWPRWYLGRLKEAEEDVRAALDSSSWHMYEPSARAVLGHVLIDRGDHPGAWAALELRDAEPWERTVPFAMLLDTRARLLSAEGRVAEAAADLQAAGDLLATMGNQSPFCPWRSRLGVALATAGELERGRALVAHELEQAERIGLPRGRGVALHAAAQIARLVGEDPLPLLRSACEPLAACGARVEHARALMSLGQALAGAGQRAEARSTLHEAVALAGAIGAGDVGLQAERQLRNAGGRPSARAGAGPSLTASERQAASLAARGLTNAAIAQELVVTVHTVRFHLGHVYRKLGVSGREELAAALAAGDELGAPQDAGP